MTPRAPVVGQQVLFRAAGRSCDVGACIWSGADGLLGTGPELRHTYTAPGNYTVRLTVADGGGSSDEHGVTVTEDPPPPQPAPPPDPPPPNRPPPDPPPSNRPPTVSLSVSTSGLEATFTAATADPDGDPVSVAWDFGDGETSTEPEPSHTYDRAGTYDVTVTARDERGAESVASGKVKVKRPPSRPEHDTETPAPAPTPTVAAPPPGPAVPPGPSTPSSTALARISPFPIVRVAGRYIGRSTRLTIVSVRAPKGARVIVRCTGSGCPFRRRVFRARGSTKSLRVHALQGRLLRPGAVVDVRVTQPGRIGKRTRLRFAAGRDPQRFDGCVGPTGRPRRCPA
ncbi:MAG: hypothetical protein JWO02_3520 [Solirubrobacterales bacterium]|nr:hypothetical protein [Solirubrobacterales bacterium]